MTRRLIIYGTSILLSLILLIATMVIVHNLILAIYGDVLHYRHHDVIWLVPRHK